MRLLASASRPSCADDDPAREPARGLDEPGRGPGMQPGRVDDDESDLGHRSRPAVAWPSSRRPPPRRRRHRWMAPMLAWTAARIAPSTSGASLMRTRARSAVVEVLEGELEAERRAAEIQQHERRIGAGIQHGPERCRDARRAGPEAPVLGPTGRGDGHVLAGDLGDHLAQALDERAAVGDQDQAHQSRLLSSAPRVASGCGAAMLRRSHQEESKTASRGAIERCEPVRTGHRWTVAARCAHATYTRADREPPPSPAPASDRDVAVDAAAVRAALGSLPAGRRAARGVPDPARRRCSATATTATTS